MPPIKAIEQAEFGGVDSRSNPVNMPQKRWLLCRNWIPRPDGHLELREGYMVRVYNQTGGGAAYSLTPYTVAVPDSYLNPPPPIPAYSPITGLPPPISQVLNNGTRCALYWQQGIPSQAQGAIASVACSIQAAGLPMLAIYHVQNTGRFVLGSTVIVEGVASNPTSPPNFFNGTFPIQAIGNGTITLNLGISPARRKPTPRLLPLPPPLPPPLPSPTAAFTVSPTSISFGNVSAGSAASVTVTLTFTTSASTGVGTLNSATLSNGNFTLTPSSPSASGMKNGQTTSFQVNINQSAAGSYNATLTIATSTQTFSIPVSATVLAGPGGGGGGTAITVVPPQVAFPNTTVGVASSTQPVVQVTNNSGANVVFSNPVVSNPDFTVVYPGGVSFFPLSVPNGGIFYLQFSAKPSAAGTRTGTFTLNTDDSSFPQVSISLEVVATNPGQSAYPENYAGTGGIMTAVVATPGPPEPLLLPLSGPSEQVIQPGTFPIKGMPIASTAPWHYALGKDGFLYMHNGVDAKFFDGVCFRDIGLPTLTTAQLSGIRINIQDQGPSEVAVSGAQINWHTTTPGGYFQAGTPYAFYYVFFDKSHNSVIPATSLIGGSASLSPGGADAVITGLPSPGGTIVGLMGISGGLTAGPSFMLASATGATGSYFNASMSGSGSTVTCNSNIANNSHQPHGLATGDVVALETSQGETWESNGPFTVTVTGPYTFTFQAPTGVDASTYNNESTFGQLLTIPAPASPGLGVSVTLVSPASLSLQGRGISTGGTVQLPYIDQMAKNMLPGSSIGGAQPGYQFYACIYNPITGHVGNRVPLSVRLVNTGNASITISGLPNFTLPSTEIQSSQLQDKIPTILLPTSDPEWRILIGRTGDGGEVPHACIDANGNWITTTTPSEVTTPTIEAGQLDSNSELPFDNYPPPRSHVTPATQESFALFWREGDRLCGVLRNSPFVWCSGSELDSTTGIFVGDPAQAWDPAKIETFPTAENIIGGFGYLQESWCYTRNDVAQLSELSGERTWNGPYNFGIVGSFAFDRGWQSLPYWVSHDRQLCTILPGGNGPISISTEYERSLLARIGDEYDPAGNPLMYMGKTQVVYFRDPNRLVDCLRIKCVDNTGKPFTIIHDFNLRDDSSPYGQGYEENYLGPLSIDYQQVYIRDSMALSRMWAAASDGQIYQFYTGGLDNCDYYDGTIGDAFIADAIALRYMGGERTVARTLEWYGDNTISWFIFENMLNVTADSNTWVDVTEDMRPFPGDAQAAHYIADIQRPEMIHCYLWAQLQAHPADAATPSDPTGLNPMALSIPYPHIPLEQYGRLYLAAPWLGGTRGR